MPEVVGLFPPEFRPGDVHLHAAPLAIHAPQIELRLEVSSLRRLELTPVPPTSGLWFLLLEPELVPKQLSEQALRLLMTLLDGLEQPVSGFVVVLVDAPADAEHSAEIALRLRVPLFRTLQHYLVLGPPSVP